MNMASSTSLLTRASAATTALKPLGWSIVVQLGAALSLIAAVFALPHGLHAATPADAILRPDQAAGIQAMVAPGGFEQDVIPGWRCEGIRITRAAVFVRARGAAGAFALRLVHPERAGDGDWRLPHYEVHLRSAEGAGAREAAAALVAAMAARDVTDPWRVPQATSAGAGSPEEAGLSASLGPLALTSLLGALLLGGIALLVRRRRAPRSDDAPPRSGRRALLALIPLLGFTAFGVAASLNWLGYGIQDFDFGIYANGFWNARAGHGFWNAPENLDHLGSHASWFLWLLLPIYALLPSGLTVLLLNALALALAAVPALLLARRRLPEPAASLLTLALLAHPAMTSLNGSPHAVSFALPLLLGAFWALESGRRVAFFVLLGLALACKESVGLAAVMMGLLALGDPKTRGVGWAALAMGLGWLVLSVGALIPAMGGDLGDATLYRYGHLGGSLGELLLSPLTRPGAWLDALFTRASGAWLLALLLPFGLLPLLAPRALLVALPFVLQDLASSDPTMRSMDFYFEALILPGLFVAAADGAARLCRARDEAPPRPGALSALCAATLVALALVSHAWVGAPWIAADDEPAVAELLALERRVPAEVPVAAPKRLQPHLATRRVAGYVTDELARHVLEEGQAQVVVLTRAQREQTRAAQRSYELTFTTPGYVMLERPSAEDRRSAADGTDNGL